MHAPTHDERETSKRAAQARGPLAPLRAASRAALQRRRRRTLVREHTHSHLSLQRVYQVVHYRRASIGGRGATVFVPREGVRLQVKVREREREAARLGGALDKRGDGGGGDERWLGRGAAVRCLGGKRSTPHT